MSRHASVGGGIVLAGLLVSSLAGGALAQDASTAPAGTPMAMPSGPPPTSLTVLCTPQEDWCQAMVAAFSAQTGIPTTYVRLSSGEALARLRASASAPEFSVWWGGPADGFVAADAEGLLDPYISPESVVVADTQKDPDGAWTGVYVGALGFCSNAKVLAELGVVTPDSWDDLLDPQLQGQVAMGHPASSGTAYTALYTQVERLGGEDAALEYMKQLHNNILQYTKSGAAPAEMTGRGEVGVGIVFSHDCVKNFDAGFKDLVTSFPAEGTGYEIGGVALIKGGPEPIAARMWTDWSLTAAAQEIGATVASYQLPTNPNAAVSERSVDLSQVNLVDYDFQAAGEARAALTQRFEDEVAAQPVE
jgi:iron(III) transport system substrate-binding protein